MYLVIYLLSFVLWSNCCINHRHEVSACWSHKSADTLHIVPFYTGWMGGYLSYRAVWKLKGQSRPYHLDTGAISPGRSDKIPGWEREISVAIDRRKFIYIYIYIIIWSLTPNREKKKMEQTEKWYFSSLIVVRWFKEKERLKESKAQEEHSSVTAYFVWVTCFYYFFHIYQFP